MAIGPGDVLFSKAGSPVLVKSKDAKTGNVVLEKDFDKVQEHSSHGIKNGMTEPAREAFNTVLNAVKSDDKHSEIDKLYKRIEDLKKQGADPRLIKYLNGELQHRMLREKYQPEDYGIDVTTLGI